MSLSRQECGDAVGSPKAAAFGEGQSQKKLDVGQAMADTVPVLLVDQTIMCEVDTEGRAVILTGAMIDVELTTLFTTILTDLGHDDEEIEKAMNRLRVEYVMGRR